MKTNLLILLGSIAGLSAASAAIGTFELTYSGVPFSNTASASGVISIDLSAIPNPGGYQINYVMPAWVTGLSLTVVGATSGNGTYGLSDFGGMYWDTRAGTLDFSTELVGQTTAGDPWGTSFSGNAGDFNLFNFGANPAAPNGTSYFELTNSGVGGGTNENDQL